jgi:fatty-acyl-CoA synthase
MTTLLSRIEIAAAGNALGGAGRQVTFVSGDEYDHTTWADVHRDARSAAAAMQARGIKPGDHVAILGPTSRSLVTVLQATWLCGATVMMLPLPMRMGSLDRFIEQTRARIRSGDSAMVAMDAQFADFVQPIEGDPPFVMLDELLPADPAQRRDPAAWVRPEEDPDSLAVLQFTSGSTSEPKGVMLTHRAMCANVDAAAQAASLRSDEVVISWLPLYHDMGLVGLLTIPMTKGVSLVQGAPQDFLAKPLRWMKWISDFGGTCTAGPNFAWVLAARALRRAQDIDLSTLELALSGAEPVDPDGFRAFARAAAEFGMQETALFPAFGMAELCIAGTFPRRGVGMETDCIDGRVLEQEHFAATVDLSAPKARELAKLGYPVPGLEMRVVEPGTDNVCQDREVGELIIRGTSLTSGYYRNPEATAALISDGWLHTGDLAYMVEGQMVMCGRIKDVVIIGGRNIYPQDIEKVVGEIDDVRTGNVVAFAQTRGGKEHLVVVAETRSDDHEALIRRIKTAVTDEIGIPAGDVVLVPPATVPKTSSGKLQRSACAAAYLAGDYAHNGVESAVG